MDRMPEDSGIIKQQLATVCTNPTDPQCAKSLETSKNLTILHATAQANQKFDPAQLAPETPLKIVQAFQGSHTVCTSVSVLGALFILYGLLT